MALQIEIARLWCCAQILTDLGVSQMFLLSNARLNVVSLEGYDLGVDWKPLQQES